ncbi:MAG: hypothetical protein JRF36_03465 [Deltaproteobacteria bacterium]|nr:hypothetical protein [Deltaproteobacteria bacterium]MBW2468027.1 hypothetical protein [Deltaproteobacteria bacterium]MBW2517696.1 hypothetical protein [Deltaproteobacteria bacterium]
MPKRISTTLLFAVLITALVVFSHTAVSAKVCLFRIGGTCIFWSGSVIGELTATKTEGLDGASWGFTIDRMSGGIVYCSDSEKGTVRSEKIGEDKVRGFKLEASEKIKKGDIIDCGSERIANVAPVARLDEADLDKLDKICGPNSEAIGFVPFSFIADVILKDPKYGIETETMECKLPEDALWDKNNKRPEKIQYKCDDEK